MHQNGCQQASVHRWNSHPTTWLSIRGPQVFVKSVNARNQQIRSVRIFFPHSLILSTPRLVQGFPPHYAVSMDQLEPANQVVAMLPVKSSPERGLDSRGKGQLPHYIIVGSKLPPLITNTAGEMDDIKNPQPSSINIVESLLDNWLSLCKMASCDSFNR